MENNKEIKIVPPKGYVIDKENSTFEKIVFNKIETILPKSWKEQEKVKGYYINGNSIINDFSLSFSNNKANRNVFFSKDEAKAALALAQLSQLKKIYNDGWEPDWVKSKIKYSIVFMENEIKTINTIYWQAFLTFKTPEIRDEFLKNFKDLIMEAKPLL